MDLKPLPGFEPGTSALPTSKERGVGDVRVANFNYLQKFNFKISYQLYEEQFIEWANKKYSKGYGRSCISYNKKTFALIKDYSPRGILNTIEKNNLHKEYSLRGIRSFLIFCSEKDYIQENIIDYYKSKLPITQKYRIDSFTPNINHITKLLEYVRNPPMEFPNNDLHEICAKLLIESGLRITEIDYFFRTFDGNFEEYENIVVIPLYYLRHNKQSYYMFLTKETFYLFNENRERFKSYSPEGLKTYIKRHNLTSLKYMRKYNFTILIKAGINLDIANFIQGRTVKNVGFNHYLAKKELSLIEYKKIKSFY